MEAVSDPTFSIAPRERHTGQFERNLKKALNNKIVLFQLVTRFHHVNTSHPLNRHRSSPERQIACKLSGTTNALIRLDQPSLDRGRNHLRCDGSLVLAKAESFAQ